MAEQPEPIQAQLIKARRNQILDAATQVFATKGFHGATIRQIAQQAEIADGTIYIYFKTKTDLLLGILNRLNESERRKEDMTQEVGGDFASFFCTYLRHRLQVIDADFQAFQAILPDILRTPELRNHYYTQVIEPTFSLTEPIFQTWIAQGLIKPVNLAVTIRTITAMVMGLLVLRMLGDRVAIEQWAQFPEVMTALILHGLAK
ncbi:MAG: TetR/AcrR family transcriptional regulator [Chloroflexi bacterium]|nr:TetR/AcrR family transcriptional regulator [Chloroflexota bacterium]